MLNLKENFTIKRNHLQQDDPWYHIINDFYTLDETKLKLSRLNNKWKLTLTTWDHEIVEWAEKELKKFHDVEFLENSWFFNNEKSAEKFITLFYLKWAA